MIGPLPKLYRTLCALSAILFCVVTGAWLATMTAVPVVPQVGAGIGAAAGVIAAYLLVHNSGERQPPPRRRPGPSGHQGH